MARKFSNEWKIALQIGLLSRTAGESGYVWMGKFDLETLRVDVEFLIS